ncbi:hypothetical protein [Devosia limi]|uniref:hypothetical protein n=1 Tax=Devosia limi TaxID=288995 RepID=UPI0015B40175|nr:hypothetical protein [Devosia limi]
MDGKNLQIIGYRDGGIAALASYDIAELAAGLGKCADSGASRRYSRLLAKARPEADLR